MVTSTPSLFPLSGGPFNPPQKRVRLLRDQPAYRISQNATACSVPELLAAVIGGERQIETAEALLAHFNGDLRRIYQAHPVELSQVRGISQALAVRVKAALTLGIRMQDPIETRTTINSPADAAALVQHDMSLLDKEHLRVMLLNIRNQVLDIVEVYQGSVSSAQVRIAEVLRPAVQRMAPAIIVVHCRALSSFRRSNAKPGRCGCDARNCPGWQTPRHFDPGPLDHRPGRPMGVDERKGVGFQLARYT